MGILAGRAKCCKVLVKGDGICDALFSRTVDTPRFVCNTACCSWFRWFQRKVLISGHGRQSL